MSEMTWTDITEYVLGAEDGPRLELAPWQSAVLTAQVDNRAGIFQPGQDVSFHIRGKIYGPYAWVSWDEHDRLMAEAKARRARLSRMHSAYSSKRRSR